MLVIGSGASGLAAAVSAETAGARVALATKGSIQSCNSAKAQGGIQAAFGEDDSPEQHAAGRLEELARDGGHAARRGAHLGGAVGDPLARGARRRVHAGERRLPARALRWRVAEAAAPGRRPHRARDHRRAPRRGRGRLGHPLPEVAARGARARRARLARALRRAHDRRVHGDPRRRRPLLRRGRAARRAVHEPSRRDRRGDADRARHGRAGARPRRAPVPPERRRVARDDAGVLDPGDDARVRRRPPQRRRRGVHRLARPARRRQPGDRRRGGEGQGRRDAGRPPRRLARHDADRPARRGAVPPVHAAPLPRRGNRPARREALHVSRPPLPERRSRHRRGRRDDARRAVRLRRDRRRHARAQPHDGQLAARVRRLRPEGRTLPQLLDD